MPCHAACGILVTNQGWNPCPLQCKGRDLTTGPPAKSWYYIILNAYFHCVISFCVCVTWFVFFFHYHHHGISQVFKVLVAQLCLTFCDPMDCSLPGSSVHGILQARIVEWVAISFSKDSSWSRDRTWSSALQVESLPLSCLGSTRCLNGSCNFPNCFHLGCSSHITSYRISQETK